MSKVIPPFPNKYQVKLVASSDSKSCTICYKPTTTVLLCETKLDFFYVCPQHLLDENFASPIHPQDYLDLISTKEKLVAKKVQLDKDIEKESPYIWNKVTDYWKKKEDSKPSESEKSKYEKLKEEMKELLLDLEKTANQIKEYKFKVYKLHDGIYKNRLMLHQKKKYNKERSEKIQQQGFFPSVPSNKLE